MAAASGRGPPRLREKDMRALRAAGEAPEEFMRAAVWRRSVVLRAQARLREALARRRQGGD